VNIPFSDLNAQHREVRKEIERAVKSVMQRGDFILGKDVREFEQESAHFFKSRFAVGVSSGTDALFLALDALGIGAGDEVIVPAFTYIATALSVSYTNARPVFVDIDKKSYCLDSELLRKSITRRTKAIIVVHLYGHTADMDEVMKIAKEHNVYVIEDAAQAHGARIKMADGKWHMAGAIGDIGCFSFYPSKNLGAMGDGGLVITNSEDIFKRVCMLRDYGRISKYEHALIGYNARLDTLQAAILRCKLKRLNKWNGMRRKVAQWYTSLFQHDQRVITPTAARGIEHVYHVYAIRIPNRDAVHVGLAKKGINAIVHYPIPLHLQPAYRDLGYRKGDFSVAEKVAEEIISLPMFPHMTKNQVRYVVSTVRKTIG
jgi:dTDP-4-amino-4,6-dideoxygalactose transaminase